VSNVHELAICDAIAGATLRHAGGRRVTRIHVRIGRLRQVVPDTLAYCWQMHSCATVLDGSALDVESVPARIRCTDCEQTTELDGFPLLICGHCDGVDVTVVSGEEFAITGLDVEDPAHEAEA
jgi:hydrogenase nickel incorporation protein HypA/HybF